MNCFGAVIERGGTMAEFAFAIVDRRSDDDRPLSERLAQQSVHPRYHEEINERIAEVAKAKARTLKDAVKGFADSRDRWEQFKFEHSSRSDRSRAKAKPFLAMKARVEAWEPAPVLAKLKQSMLEQIAENMRFEGLLGGDDFGESRLDDMTTEQWRYEQITEAQRLLGYSRQRLQEEIERVREHNEFCAELLKEFPLAEGA